MHRLRQPFARVDPRERAREGQELHDRAACGVRGILGEVPYVVALIELEEGPTMMSNVVGCDAEQVLIDMPVEVTFEDWTADVTVPLFKPRVGAPQR